jgi:hypothetical protein
MMSPETEVRGVSSDSKRKRKAAKAELKQMRTVRPNCAETGSAEGQNQESEQSAIGDLSPPQPLTPVEEARARLISRKNMRLKPSWG